MPTNRHSNNSLNWLAALVLPGMLLATWVHAPAQREADAAAGWEHHYAGQAGRPMDAGDGARVGAPRNGHLIAPDGGQPLTEPRIVPLWSAPDGIANSETASRWLAVLKSALAEAPAGCPPAAAPGLAQDVPSRAFRVRLPATAEPQPYIVYSRDLILARFITVTVGSDGCPQVFNTGRDFPFAQRSLTSPFANARLSSAAGATAGSDALVVLQDAKTKRAWLMVEPEATFERSNALAWTLIGGYIGLLTVLGLIGLSFAVWQRSRLAIAYVFYILMLQFYQLEAMGVGPAWIPFWPHWSYAQIMQGLAAAAVVLGVGTAVVVFLRPQPWLRSLLVLGIGVSVSAFIWSGWYPVGYRLGAISLAFLAATTLFALVRGLRNDAPYLRWFALGLAATMVGGGFQASTVFSHQEPALFGGVAFSVGNLVESLLWVIALASQIRRERQQLQHQLVHDATHDHLTGLPNRRFLIERLEQRLRQAKDGTPPDSALLLLDLDRFQVINDSLGHGVGDRLLIRIGQLLREQVPPDAVVTRLGGDEFGILLPQADAATRTAAALTRIFAGPIELGGRPIHVKCSIGVLELADERIGMDATEVLRDADTALTAAKSRGGNSFVAFADALRASTVRRFELEQDLPHSLRGNDFQLFYQPVVDLRTGAMAGMEALIRWQHPRLGWLSPVEFVPLAEASGMIKLLGDWVLGEAASQILAWKRAGVWHRRLYVSVNLSGGQLLDADLPDHFDAVLGGFEVAPGELRVELTETAVIANLGVAQQVLPALRRRGIALCMDDFGTGYSSLSYLNELSFDVLKVDRSFVDGMDQRPRKQGLVRSILALSRELGLQVIAEGIETGDQATLLRDMGCRYGQGYHYAKPMPAAALGDWLDDLGSSELRIVRS